MILMYSYVINLLVGFARDLPAISWATSGLARRVAWLSNTEGEEHGKPGASGWGGLPVPARTLPDGRVVGQAVGPMSGVLACVTPTHALAQYSRWQCAGFRADRGGGCMCSSDQRHPCEGRLPPRSGQDSEGSCSQDSVRPVAVVPMPAGGSEYQRLTLTPAQQQMVLANVRRLRELREQERAARLARESPASPDDWG